MHFHQKQSRFIKPTTPLLPLPVRSLEVEKWDGEEAQAASKHLESESSPPPPTFKCTQTQKEQPSLPSPPVHCTTDFQLWWLSPLSPSSSNKHRRRHICFQKGARRGKEKERVAPSHRHQTAPPPPSSHSFLSRAFARIVNAIFLVCTRLLPSSLRRWRYRISGRGCGVFSFPGE